MNEFRRTKRPKRAGFVLVTTLLIIAMVAMLTVGLARFSMNKAVDTMLAESDLQHRWGTASCQRYALAHSGRLLNKKSWDDENEEWVSHPILSTSCRFDLGDQVFLVRLADESAKLDLNFVYENASREKTKSLARKFAAKNGLTIDLRPLSQNRQRGLTEHSFESWGQVFTSIESQDVGKSLFETTKSLTCWSQRLNLRSAPDDILLESCKLVAGASIAHRVVQARRSDELTQTNELLDSIGANERQRQSLRNLLTDQSRAQSIWVTAAAAGQPRYSMIVRENFNGSLSRIYSFQW